MHVAKAISSIFYTTYSQQLLETMQMSCHTNSWVTIHEVHSMGWREYFSLGEEDLPQVTPGEDEHPSSRYY